MSEVRRTVLREKARSDALVAEAASIFLDVGITPEFMRHRMSDPGLADIMAELLYREAAIWRELRARDAKPRGRAEVTA